MTKKWHWNHRFLSLSTLLLGVGVYFLSLNYSSQLRINVSDSLPQTLFLTTTLNSEPEKGQIILIEHPTLKVSAGKIVVGKPGDLISIKDQTLFINDEVIGQIKQKSSSGKTYQPISPGEISKGYYFVYTPHCDSFDSRYAEFGLVPANWIKGVLWPLF